MARFSPLPRAALAALLASSAALADAPPLRHPKETRLANVRQLTFGGENAEAYFDRQGKRLVFQTTRPPHACDQIYVMDLASGQARLVSTGKGRTTCAYFLPDGQHVLYSSTHLAGPDCPPKPDYRQGYVWPIYAAYDIFVARLDGGIVRRLTDSPGYDAEATVAPDGSRIVFTSLRDGDLDIYSMKLDGSDTKRLTSELGYDGGPFYSPDSQWIVYRAHHPESPAEQKRYRELLAQGLIEPRRLDLWVMRADGSAKRRVTNNGAANFCPFFHPGGKKIVFSSNQHDPRGRDFDLYLVNTDGTGLERVTHDPQFDGFPMFSPDGKQLVWAANRGGKARGETNLFLADWVERP